MTDVPAGAELSFEATLENWAEGLDSCAVAVPETTETLGTRGPVLVHARVNDSAPFKVSLFPVGGGRHDIRIEAAVRKATRTVTGDRARIRIEVLDRAALDDPADLLAAPRTQGATTAFKALPPGRQNFIVRRIEEAVKPEMRQKRILDAVADVQTERKPNDERS